MQDMRIAWEEPFGPIIPVIRVKNIDDAIDHCNSNNLALQVWPVCTYWPDVMYWGFVAGPRPGFKVSRLHCHTATAQLLVTAVLVQHSLHRYYCKPLDTAKHWTLQKICCCLCHCVFAGRLGCKSQPPQHGCC